MKKRTSKPLKLFPHEPKPKGFHFRKYKGGEHDGLIEQCPMRTARSSLKQSINKPEWRGSKLVRNNIYKLAEPAIKAQFGATYIYTYKA